MKAERFLANNLPARLIPSFKRPERKLLSVFMSVLNHCPNFRGQLLRDLGYNSGRTATYSSYMEPIFEAPSVPPGRPDGMLICKRGTQSFCALLEAKRDDFPVLPEQIQKYLDLGKFLDADCVVSISNEFSPSIKETPYHIASNKLRGRALYHWSWSYLENQMTLYIEENEAEPFEVGIIQEALHFFADDNSGIKTFEQMPVTWPDFVQSAGTSLGFNKKTSGLSEIVHAWHQERRDLAIKLNGALGGGVKQAFPRSLRYNEAERVKLDRNFLADDYLLTALFDLPINGSTCKVVADLRGCSINCQVSFDPPEQKKAKGVSSWLARALSSQDTSSIEQIVFHWSGRIPPSTAELDAFLKFPEAIIENQKEAPKSICFVSSCRDVRRFKSRKRFIEDLEKTVIALVTSFERLKL